VSSDTKITYVPLLPAKRGELTALRDSTPAVLQAIRPVIEIPPSKWDWEEDAASETIDQQIAAAVIALPKYLGALPGFFLDLPNLADGALLQTGQHPVTEILAKVRASNLQATPVTGPDRDSAYRAAVRASLDDKGAMVRVRSSHLGPATTTTLLGDELAALGLSADHVDLLIDLGRIQTDPSILALGVAAILRHARVTEHSWRSITVASGGFPESMAAFSGVGKWAAERHDRALWVAVRSQLQAGERVPWFGDYGVQVPNPEAVDPRLMTMSANIRYTLEENWLVLKGRTISGKKAKATYDEFRVLCTDLVAMPQYRGATFSEGDRYIKACADSIESPGNAEVWRRNGTSHHLAHVVNALASTGAP
jgi:hypothetical protein